MGRLSEAKNVDVIIRAIAQLHLHTSDRFGFEQDNYLGLLRQYKAQDPDLPVIIKADSTLQYQKVVDVLDLVGKLEITQLGLVTQRVVK